MKRINWTERLAETLEAHRHLPFRWGGRGDAHDCCTLVADCVDAMTGSRVLDELLEEYHDEATAREFIERSGGLVPAISSLLGQTKCGSPRSGDVVAVKRLGIEFVGIVIDDEILSAGFSGYITNRLARARAAWSV